MKVAALFSGGKDSTYSIFQTQKQGNKVECLITIFPKSPDSLLLHHPNIEITKLQATSMRIPQKYIESSSLETSIELHSIHMMLEQAKIDYGIEGLIHGGILSHFQKNNFEKICNKLNLTLISPIWNKNQKRYMYDLLASGFRFIITSVSSAGLDDSWLGTEINAKNLATLERLSLKFGFNLNFEGGEAETLVVDCPLFSFPLKIIKARKLWDGYRGRFEIEEASLDYNVRKSQK